jgi:hypothetical protein
MYTTTNLEQAKRFAEIQNRTTNVRNTKPAVIEFTLERNHPSKLESMWFVQSSNDFWILVESCRRFGTTNRTPNIYYDVVVGPVVGLIKLVGPIRVMIKLASTLTNPWKSWIIVPREDIVMVISSAELTARKGYWLTVQACLEQFHELSKQRASAIVIGYQKGFPIASSKPEIVLIYHVEPFSLACKVTGESLDITDFVDEYQVILEASRASAASWMSSKRLTAKTDRQQASTTTRSAAGAIVREANATKYSAAKRRTAANKTGKSKRASS